MDGKPISNNAVQIARRRFFFSLSQKAKREGVEDRQAIKYHYLQTHYLQTIEIDPKKLGVASSQIVISGGDAGVKNIDHLTGQRVAVNEALAARFSEPELARLFSNPDLAALDFPRGAKMAEDKLNGMLTAARGAETTERFFVYTVPAKDVYRFGGASFLLILADQLPDYLK
ncbi:MAG: hypothetical protein WC632_04905 [Candidatus Margulisiibacteriota bacterium]